MCRLCSEKLNQILLDGKCVCNSQSTDKDGVCVLNIGQPYNFLATISYGNSSSANSNNTGLSTSSTFGSATSIATTTIITTTTTTNTIPVVVNSTVTSTPQVIISNGTCS